MAWDDSLHPFELENHAVIYRAIATSGSTASLNMQTHQIETEGAYRLHNSQHKIPKNGGATSITIPITREKKQQLVVAELFVASTRIASFPGILRGKRKGLGTRLVHVGRFKNLSTSF